MQRPLTEAGYIETDNEKDLESVIAEYETPLLRYASRILRDSDAAQDVVQNTFLKLYRSKRNGSWPHRQLSGWLYRVTHNHAVDYIRRESRLRVLHQEQAEDSEVSEQAREAPLAREEAMALALEHIRKLDLAEQQVVILRLQEGKSYKEIAAITQRSQGNVGCILHHAVKKLKDSLKRAGVV